MKKTFKKGVHPSGFKDLSKDKQIEIMPAPKDIYIPLSQHIGGQAESVKNVGDRVLKGELLGKKKDGVSANVYSSVSGKIVEIVKRVTASGGFTDHVHIENDFLDETVKLEKMTEITPESITNRIQEAGIVGMGGATFPSHIKIAGNSKIDTLILNGAECEPYITCDYRLMLEKTDELIKGALLIAKVFDIKQIFIGIEDNKMEAIEKLSAYDSVTVIPLKTKYPQGGEKQIIYACTNRKVPDKKLPMDVGCVVTNVHTAYSVYEAVELDKPCYERFMTVSGLGVNEPKNLQVSNGTLFSDILEYCGGVKENVEIEKVICGGTMMGFAQYSLNASTGKGTSSILFLTKDEINLGETMNCINCAKCVSVCPMNIMPVYIDAHAMQKDFVLAKKYGAMSCIECGSCAFTCPAKRPLVQSIRYAKKMIRERGI